MGVFIKQSELGRNKGYVQKPTEVGCGSKRCLFGMEWEQEGRVHMFVKSLFAEGLCGVLSCQMPVLSGRYKQVPSSGEQVIIIHLII